ncbi:hypothetical protein GYH30_031298 [Glycine max]|uniref:Uncharacterized protein n=1 Tax=Glycine max TaxID=3847 RepID=A0A0R0HHG9_SOYBN|nr:hypothetical protein GYH30_031298 [Glycine max]
MEGKTGRRNKVVAKCFPTTNWDNWPTFSSYGGTSAYIQVNIPTPENIKRVVQCMRLPLLLNLMRASSRKHYPISRKANCNTRTCDLTITQVSHLSH